MNQNVSPAVATLVFVILGAFLAALYHVNDRSLAVDHLRLATLHPDGSPVVMMGNQLHKLDLARQRDEVITLADLGIAGTVGGFAFLGNGDLLVVADQHRPGVWEKLAIWGRSANRDYARSDRNQLLRCDLAALTCQRFSPDLPDFTRTFRLFVDQRTDEVYLADTSRHRLLKLDAEGRQLATRDGFKFPNQLRLVDGELWLADTNHHGIKRLDTGTERFGEALENHRVDLGSGHRWPSDMVRMGARWWVLVHDQDMANGRLAVYDSGWQLLHTLPLPPGADVMGIVAVGDRLLITDYGRFALYLFSGRGERLDTPALPALDRQLSAAREFRQRYQWAAWGLQGLLFLLIAAGLIYAVIQQKRHLVGSPVAAASPPDLTDSPPH